jgi:hypothetical protein
VVRSQAINREPVAAKLEKEKKRSSVGGISGSSGGIIGVLENGDLKMVIEEMKVQSLTKSRFESPEVTKL